MKGWIIRLAPKDDGRPGVPINPGPDVDDLEMLTRVAAGHARLDGAPVTLEYLPAPAYDRPRYLVHANGQREDL